MIPKRAKNPLTGEAITIPTKKAATKKAATKKAATKKAATKKAATKKAATKKAATKESASDVLRGVGLVDAVMEARRRKGEKLIGTPAAEVAKMKLGDVPLSPALARWLELDAKMFSLGEPESLVDLLEREVDVWADAFHDLCQYLDGPCVIFEGWGCDSRRFLYLGAKDAHGEYPVFTIDTDDTPFACINGPVDVWLAQQAGFLEEEEFYGVVPRAYEPARVALAKMCFGGNIAFLDGEFSKKLDPYGI